MLPTYVYERLGVAHNKQWSATIKREAVHVFHGEAQNFSQKPGDTN
jgi:hypothetical protein